MPQRTRKSLVGKMLIGTLLGLLPIPKTVAQHVSDNPVLSAEDAFGLTVGLESTGIYNPFMVRGYNPQVAGNARIDGLYFDQQGNLSNRVIDGSTIRVGISAIDAAFPAPTGVVDYQLRRATGEQPTGSVIAELGPFDDHSISIDGSLPLYSTQLQLPIGANVESGAAPANGNGANLGYTANLVNLGAAPLWTPNDRLSVRLLVDWENMTSARTLPTVFTAGNFLPPRIGRGFLGQYWALGHFVTENFGGMLDAKLSQHWSLKAGLFRSIADSPISYADLFMNTEPNGIADHVLVGIPDQRTASTSGEVRLSGLFTHGNWRQNVILMARGRDTQALYGGFDTVDVGSSYIGAPGQVPEPAFNYGARTSDHTTLWSSGAAYRVANPDLGELALGLQQEHYDKTVRTPGVGQSQLTAVPLRLYASAAMALPEHAILFSGYTQGFEDSGAVPSSAVNRGAILPTTRTWQVDGGVRYPVTPKLSLIAGYFVLDKPYFNFDTKNVDRMLGVQQASGLELSVAGQLARGLTINAGALIGRVQVLGSDLAAQGVGPEALGQSRNTWLINLDYTLPDLPALTADVSILHFSAVPAVVSDAYDVPGVVALAIGVRYQFKLFGAPALLRVQVPNTFNAYIWNIAFSPGFSQFAPRTLLGYLTVDL